MKNLKQDIEQIDELDVLIELSYDVFAHYRPHTPLEVCCRSNCCISEQSYQLIQQIPICQLPANLLYEYLDAAEGCDPKALSSEIRYFMPRIFELMAQNCHIRHSTELTLNKCHLEQGVWLKHEIAIFERFAQLFFIKKLNHAHSFYIEIFEQLVMFYLSGLSNTSQLLTILLDELVNKNVLIGFCYEVYYFKNGYYQNSFAPNELIMMIDEWLHDNRTKTTIVQLIFSLIQSDDYMTLTDEQKFWLDCAFDRFAS